MKASSDGERIYEGLLAVARALNRLASADEGKAISMSRWESAIADSGQVIATAIEVHSESIDRLADAVETLAP